MNINIPITHHAMKRMQQRGVSYDDVVDAVLCGKPKVSRNKRIHYKRCGLYVIMADDGSVVSVWRGKDRKKYVQKRRQELRKLRRETEH